MIFNKNLILSYDIIGSLKSTDLVITIKKSKCQNSFSIFTRAGGKQMSIKKLWENIIAQVNIIMHRNVAKPVNLI